METNDLLNCADSGALIRSTAEASGETELKQILHTAGITDLTDDALHSACRVLELSRDSRKLMAAFMKEYSECEEYLAEEGIVLTPGEYDLVRDVMNSTVDASLVNEINHINDIASAAAVLKNRGYYHITAEFMRNLMKYAGQLDHPQLMDESASAGFMGSVEKNITYLAAADVISALSSGENPVFRSSDLFAAAGGYELMRKKTKSLHAK